jgi:hypothetical protein
MYSGIRSGALKSPQLLTGLAEHPDSVGRFRSSPAHSALLPTTRCMGCQYSSFDVGRSHPFPPASYPGARHVPRESSLIRLASPPCRTPPGQSTGTHQIHPGTASRPQLWCQPWFFRHVNSNRLSRRLFPHRSPRQSSANTALGVSSPPQSSSEAPAFISHAAPPPDALPTSSSLQRS